LDFNDKIRGFSDYESLYYGIMAYETVGSGRDLEIFHRNILPPNLDGGIVFNFFELFVTFLPHYNTLYQLRKQNCGVDRAH